MASRKRPRVDSGIRVQVSHPSTSTTPAHTQTNTHIHLGVHTSGDARSRPSVRMSHASRPADVVDLSAILASENVEDSAMVNAQFDSFSEEDASNIAFGLDEEVVEDPDSEDDENGGDEDEETVVEHAKASVSKHIQTRHL